MQPVKEADKEYVKRWEEDQERTRLSKPGGGEPAETVTAMSKERF